MKNNSFILSHNNTINIFLVSAVLSFFLAFIAYGEFIISDMMIYDDTIYLSKSLLGFDISHKNSPLFFYMIEILSKFNSVVIFKIIWLMFHSCSSGLISAIISKVTDSVWVPIMIGVLIGLIPIHEQAIIFITGSHSTIGLTFLLLGFFTLIFSYQLSSWRFILANVGATLQFLVAAAITPTAFLTPLVSLFWLVIILFKRKKDYISIMLSFSFSLMPIILVFALTGVGEYHYSNLVGWVDYSLSQIFQNLVKSTEMAFSFITKAKGFTKAVYYTAFVTILIIPIVHVFLNFKNLANYKSTNNKKLITIILFSIFISALTFAPGSITTSISSRYLVAPVVFILIPIFLIYIGFLRHANKTLRVLFSTFLAVVIFLNFTQLSQVKIDYLRGFKNPHNQIKDLVIRENGTWGDGDSQIILLTNRLGSSPTMGFNHWSSWYLRYLTQKPNIIGLVGSPQRVTRSPFVVKYRDHGSEYWEVSHGRSKRIQMIGLEKSRKTFAYLQDEDGRFNKIDRIDFSTDELVKFVLFGESYEKPLQIQSTEFFLWPSDK